jgi:hypothetical protein
MKVQAGESIHSRSKEEFSARIVTAHIPLKKFTGKILRFLRAI